MSDTGFACDTCFDTGTIDQGTTEVVCPDCGGLNASTWDFSVTAEPEPEPVGPAVVKVKISGLGHGLGDTGSLYTTATAWTGSSITFEGTRAAIAADVRRVRSLAVTDARSRGERGRSYISSGAIAVEKRVLRALDAMKSAHRVEVLSDVSVGSGRRVHRAHCAGCGWAGRHHGDKDDAWGDANEHTVTMF